MAEITATSADTTQTFRRNMRRDLRLAGLAILGFFVAGGAWAMMTELSSAVLAAGRVAVEADLQQVQYAEGGVVETILVDEGDEVARGQVLVVMETTALRSQFDISRSRVIESYLLQSRLQAEIAGQDTFEVPAELVELVGEDGIDGVYASQANLLDINRENLRSQRELLGRQLEQTQFNVEGLRASVEEAQAELALLEEELVGLEQLLEKDLVQRSRVLTQRRTIANLRGQIAQYQAQAAGAESEAAQTQLRLIQLEETYRQENLQRLQQTRADLGESINVFENQRNVLARAEIRAPRDGVVHELQVNTPGQVVAPGGQIMLIVPEDDRLIVEANVPPSEIDQVYVGQDAEVKVAAYDARLLPNLFARVTFVSADAIQNQQTGQSHFVVRLEILPDEMDKLQGIVLVPGMASQVFIKRSDRNVMTFLLQPLLESMDSMFRE